MKIGNLLFLSVLSVILAGCSSQLRSSNGVVSTVVLKQDINELEREAVPGTVNEIWAEPMYDTVEIPGQLDPSGMYYRKPHRTVVEIRQEKYQKVEYPSGDEQDLGNQR
jgi:hypothetical protein